MSLRPAAPVAQSAKPDSPAVSPAARSPQQSVRPSSGNMDNKPKESSSADMAKTKPVVEESSGLGTGAMETEANSEMAPVRRKRVSKSAAALSLDAIKEETAETSTVSAVKSLGDRIPDDAEILMDWRKLPEEYSSRPRLSTTLANAKVQISDKGDYKLVSFMVLNVAQQKWIEEMLLRELEGKLQKAMGTSKVRLAVEVVSDDHVEKKIYMPEDKAKVVMAENEEIQKLVKDFDLDVK